MLTTLGHIAYERWRQGMGIPQEFVWARLPQITRDVWEAVAAAVHEYGVCDAEEGGETTTVGEG